MSTQYFNNIPGAPGCAGQYADTPLGMITAIVPAPAWRAYKDLECKVSWNRYILTMGALNAFDRVRFYE